MSADGPLVEYGLRRWIVVIGVMSATLLQVLDATIVNVALPTIQGNMGANFDEGAWIVTGYIIAAVIVIPLTPWLQQVMGRKQYYLAAIAGFTITSALCGISTSLPELVFFRILQGLCGGGLIATGQAILRDTFPVKDLGKSQALVSLGAVVGPSIGPTLGGILTDAFSWNWIFYINIIPGILAALMIASTLRNPKRVRRTAPFDGMGLALLALGLGSLQYVLDEGERNDWLSDPGILRLSLLALIALAGFAFWETMGTKHPIVDLRILKNRTVAAGTGLALAIGFSLFGGIILSPQFQQQLLNFTATLSGESILLRALAIMLFTFVTLALINRFHVQPRVLLGTGFVIVAIGNAMQAFVTTTDSTFWTFAWPLLLGGAGFGMLFLPLSISVLRSVHGADTQKATSLISLCQQLGGSISTAVLVTLLDRRGAVHQDALAASVNAHNLALNAAVHTPVSAIAGLVAAQARTMAFGDAFMVLAVVTLLLSPLVIFLRTPRGQGAPVQIAAE
ncbi:MAG: MDR family MFS transporter [Candidatus Baltobacteraceae bacterium]